MRINELARKSVVFLGILDDGGSFAPYGTGFVVLFDVNDSSFAYLVTAKHVLDDMLATKRPLAGRINLKTGIAQVGSLTTEHWETHPTDKNCDIAVAPFIASFETFDVFGVKLTNGILTDDYIRENDIGSGDAVFTAGLLVSHFGQTKNVPIVRIGNIAAMPEDKVDLGEKLGHQDVYLVESRSIGGLSGSPVFLHTPPFRLVHGAVKEMGGHQREYLIGVHIGLFETKADGDRVRTDTAEQRETFLEAMSSGIGIVVPIQRVKEIVETSPAFRKQREDAMKKRTKDSAFVPTSAKPSIYSKDGGEPAQTTDENPNHRENFNSMLTGAAKIKTEK